MTTTPPAPSVRRGDVVLVLFPNSDLRTARLRPTLVVQADNLATDLEQHIVAMITSRMFRAGHPSRVSVLLASTEGQRSGLLSDSVIITDNLATVTGTAIDRIIGSLPMEAVNVAQAHTLGLRDPQYRDHDRAESDDE